MQDIDKYRDFQSQLINIIFKNNPNIFLSIPDIRSAISSEIIKDLIKNEIVVLEETKSRSGTLSHNIEGLIGMSGYDRGGQLTEKAIGLTPISMRPALKVLHIGARNLNELFTTLSQGIIAENIFSIDLIELPGFNSAGDMHNLPYESDSFDVVILGWVLPYSTNPIGALNEINRVAKDSAIIAIGWDFTEYSYEKSDVLNYDDAIKISSTRDIVEIINDSEMKIHNIFVSIDACYPFSEESRRNMLIFSSKKAYFSIGLIWRAEELLYRQLSASDVFKNQDSIVQRLDAAAQKLSRGFISLRNENSLDYLLMRENYVKHGSVVDDYISQNLTKIFPPMYEVSPFNKDSKFFNDFKNEIVIKGSESIGRDGYYIFPELLNEKYVNEILKSFPNEIVREGRTLIDQSELLKNSTVVDLFLDSTLVSLAERILNTVPVLDFVIGFFSRPIKLKSNEKLDEDALLYHFDKDRIKFLKIFVYLSDVDESNGPHILIPGSHKLKPGKDGRFSEDEIELLKINSNLFEKSITGKKGQVFAVDTHCLHRGSEVSFGERLVLQLEYTNSMLGAYSKIESPINFIPKYKKLINMFPRMFSQFCKLK